MADCFKNGSSRETGTEMRNDRQFRQETKTLKLQKARDSLDSYLRGMYYGIRYIENSETLQIFWFRKSTNHSPDKNVLHILLVRAVTTTSSFKFSARLLRCKHRAELGRISVTDKRNENIETA